MKKISIISLIILLFACTNTTKTTDNKFIGQWKFNKITPNDKPNDNSMNGIICPLKKVENTNETYSFSFLGGEEMLFSLKDKDTLISLNGTCKLIYNEINQQLRLNMGVNSSEIEFTKLK